jgi:hypothetical protein
MAIYADDRAKLVSRIMERLGEKQVVLQERIAAKKFCFRD